MKRTPRRRSAAKPPIRPPAGNLEGRVVMEASTNDLLDKLAGDLMAWAMQRVAKVGRFHLALSGGKTPEPLYLRLMIDPRFRRWPWKSTHLWQADERGVAPDVAQSNFHLIREWIVNNVPIPPEQVHPMQALKPDGDRLYEDLLQQQVGDGRLDAILLGLGEDGHTASLFPRSPALRQSTRWVAFNDGAAVAGPKPRLTLTYPMINAARRIYVLVTGRAKRPILRRLLRRVRGAAQVGRLPILGVKPVHDDAQMSWYLDGEATGEKMKDEG